MTFYGESLELDWANNLSGSGGGTSGDELRYHFDGTSTTVVAGDEFIVGAYMFGGGVSGLTDTDAVACSWVLEVGPATNGSLSLAAGLDPGFALTDPALATTGLGTHALAGASTLVLPVTLQTAAEILAATSEQVLRVQGVSGTVELLQVKLRVWPEGGPAGAWTSGSGYSEPVTGMRLTSTNGEGGTAPDLDHFGTAQNAADDAQQRARVLIDGMDGAMHVYGETSTSIASDMNLTVTGPYTDGSFTAEAGLNERNAYLLANTDGLVPSPPSGYGFDPREVPSESQSHVRGIGGGSASAAFGGWVGGFTVSCDNVNTTESGLYGVTDLAGPPAITQTSTGYQIAWHSYASLAAGSIAGGSSASVSLSGHGQYVVLTPTTTGRNGAFTPASVTGVGIIQQVTLSAIDPTFIVVYGDFQWFDPSLPWAPDRQPRFFVKDWQQEWVPVGYGKPATETRIFRVKLGARLYRDLTPAEYAALPGDTGPSGGYPLKVRLWDWTWTIVAWLVPET